MSTSVFQRKLDFAPAASINKVALNNKVVMMRAVVRRAKLHLINKLVKMIQKLKNKKGTDEQQKSNKNKADRLLEEIKIIKMLRHDYVSKFALGSTEIFEEVAKNPNSTIDKRALVRLSQQKFIQDVVTKFRREHDDWKELAAYLMTKHTSREYKTKKTKQKMKTVEANVKLTETLVQAYLGEKLGDVKHDDDDDNGDDDYENQGENDGPDSDIVRSSDGLEKINESYSDDENNEINENNDSADDDDDDDDDCDDDDNDDDDDDDDDDDGDDDGDDESAASEENENLTESSSSKNVKYNRNVNTMRNLSSNENIDKSDDDDDDDDDESSDQDNVNEDDNNDDDEVSGSYDEDSDDDDDDDEGDDDHGDDNDNDDDDDENLNESDELIEDHIGSALGSKKSSETNSAKAGLLTKQEKPEPKSQQRLDKKENKKKSQKIMGEKNPPKPKMVEKVQGEMIVKKINLDSLADDNEIPAILLTNSSEEKPIKKKKRKDMFFEMDDDDDDGESGIDDSQTEEGGEYGGTEGYGDYTGDGSQGQGVQLGMNAFSTTFVGSLRSSEMMGCKDGKYRSNEDWKRIRHEMKDAKMGRGGGSSFPPRGRGQSSFGGRGSFRGQGGSFRGQDSFRGQGTFRGRGTFGDQGSFRGQGSFRAQDSRGRGGFGRGQTGGDNVKPKPQKAESLHPSWEASKKRKQQEKGGIQAFTGKKIKFD